MSGAAGRRPRRILLVETNDDGTAGGSYQCLFDLARGMDPVRFTPVALFHHENRFASGLREADIPVHIWELAPAAQPGTPETGLDRLGRKLRAIRRRLDLIRSERIDLVHLNNSPAAGCTEWLPAAWRAGVPCVTHARGEIFPARLGWFSRFCIPRFDRVIAISGHIARAMERAGIPPGRIVQVYDGIDAGALRAAVTRAPDAVRCDLGVPDGRLLVLMVGHLRSWKGQEQVLDALAALDDAVRRRLYVVFAGPTPRSERAYEERLARRVTDLDLTEEVAFLGERTDVPDLMNAADIVLHASTVPEPFGLVVLEGLAFGKTVVASDLGGPAEILDPGSGLRFDPADPAALPGVLTRLVERPETRIRSAAARARAEAFPVTRTVDAIQAVYATLLRESTGVLPRDAVVS